MVISEKLKTLLKEEVSNEIENLKSLDITEFREQICENKVFNDIQSIHRQLYKEEIIIRNEKFVKSLKDYISNFKNLKDLKEFPVNETNVEHTLGFSKLGNKFSKLMEFNLEYLSENLFNYKITECFSKSSVFKQLFSEEKNNSQFNQFMTFQSKSIPNSIRSFNINGIDYLFYEVDKKNIRRYAFWGYIFDCEYGKVLYNINRQSAREGSLSLSLFTNDKNIINISSGFNNKFNYQFFSNYFEKSASIFIRDFNKDSLFGLGFEHYYPDILDSTREVLAIKQEKIGNHNSFLITNGDNEVVGKRFKLSLNQNLEFSLLLDNHSCRSFMESFNMQLLNKKKNLILNYSSDFFNNPIFPSDHQTVNLKDAFVKVDTLDYEEDFLNYLEFKYKS
tara:strand:- start:36066 stop:37241 length:1176 start_codon:yes stop_codon:yes gene_type:complete